MKMDAAAVTAIPAAPESEVRSTGLLFDLGDAEDEEDESDESVDWVVTFKEIAKELGVTRQRAEQIFNTAYAELKRRVAILEEHPDKKESILADWMKKRNARIQKELRTLASARAQLKMFGAR